MRHRRVRQLLQQVYFHRLGTDSQQDAYVIGKDFPRIAKLAAPQRRRALAAGLSRKRRTAASFAHYLMDADGRWNPDHSFRRRSHLPRSSARTSTYLLSRKRRAARPDSAAVAWLSLNTRSRNP